MPSDDEDDYMSDKFLKALEKNDTRPGLSSKHKQQKAINSSKPKAQTPFIGKKKLESLNREKGLQTSLNSNNKGFAMLQKMGYKPGMGIGKQEKGRVEPVSIELKAGRGGLGIEAEKKRKVEQITLWRAKRRKDNETRASSFQSRMSDKYSERTAERDLRTAQKACMQLDQQGGLQEPAESFFWLPSCLPTVNVDEDEDDEPQESKSGFCDTLLDSEEEDRVSESVGPDINSLLSDVEKLEMVTRYLRNIYKYCIWCGTKYEDIDDLNSNCPGNSANAHDS